MIDSDSFLLMYSQFKGIELEKIDILIARAYAKLPVEKWPDSAVRDEGVEYVVAHELQLERDDIMRQGMIMTAMEEVQNLRYDVSPRSEKMSYWDQTVYGVKFKTLARRVAGPAMFVP